MRRNRITPVLATRSANITPALLKRKFRLDARPLYPDISTRLALSELTEGRGRPHAIIYRDGLMAFAETVIGSRRMRRVVRDGTVLSWLGGLSGLLLAYYFTSVGAFAALSAPEFPVLFAAVAADGAAAGRTGAPLLIPFHTHAGRAVEPPGIFHTKRR